MLSKISLDTTLIYVGDHNQLPSVGPGNVLKEMIDCGVIPAVYLKKAYRQSEGSSIAENAQRIMQAETNLLYDNDFIFLKAENQAEAMAKVCALYQRARTAHGQDKLQILTPMRSRGECSVANLNAAIQGIIQKDSPSVYRTSFDNFFYQGDPVINTKNEDRINNGDFGFVADASLQGFTVNYVGIDESKDYDKSNSQLVQLAYALTVHKSQGQEYPLIILPVLREHSFMLNRNLLYTAITRGKYRVLIVGSMKALKWAIKKVDSTRRNTHLAKRILAFYDKYLIEYYHQYMEDYKCKKEQSA